jgi:hypothetical protein
MFCLAFSLHKTLQVKRYSLSPGQYKKTCQPATAHFLGECLFFKGLKKELCRPPGAPCTRLALRRLSRFSLPCLRSWQLLCLVQPLSFAPLRFARLRRVNVYFLAVCFSLAMLHLRYVQPLPNPTAAHVVRACSAPSASPD